MIHFLIKILWNKLSKLSAKVFSFNNTNNNNKPPKKPQNIYIPDTQNKEHKDIKKKAREMKQKILKLQKDSSLLQNDLNIDSSKVDTTLFSSNRNWKQTINIENRQNLSLKDQLTKIKYELEAYKLQKKKFKQSISDIKKGKENFYPDESKYLWKEYIEVIKHLKFNLKSMKKNLKKTKRS